MAKQRLTTYMESELIKKIKIQAVNENRSVAAILEELVRKYLESKPLN